MALVAIMALAFFMASIPHWDYAYPLHIDEWWHLGDAQSLIRAGQMPYPDPFDSGVLFDPDKEFGYHMFLASLNLTSSISWLTLFRYLPGVIFALLALQAYVFGRTMRAGLGAAFLVTLIPTTARFLGPAFVVPVAVGLTFIPLTLFVLHRMMRDFRGPLLLFLIFLSLLFLHPPTLAIVSAISAVHFFFFLIPGPGRDMQRARQSLTASALLASVYVIMLFWAPSALGFILQEAGDTQQHLAAPPITDALPKLGYIPVALAVIGAGILIRRGDRRHRAIVLTTLGLFAFQQVYPRFYLGPDIVYERGWLYLYVMLALLGGVALHEIWALMGRAAWPRTPALSAARYAATGALIAVILALSVRSHLAEPYYHVVDDATYEDFLWIKERVPSEYDVALLDTGVAWVFGAVTDRYAYAAEVAPNYHPRGRSAMEFLRDGAPDTSWLEERGITIVYSPGPIKNEELVEVRDNVYLLTK